MTAPATTKLTYGAVLATVTNTANALSAVVNSATKSAGMLDAFVTEAATRQEYTNRANRLSFVKDLVASKSLEAATADIRIEEFCAKSETHAKHFEEAHADFTKLFAKELGLAA